MAGKGGRPQAVHQGGAQQRSILAATVQGFRVVPYAVSPGFEDFCKELQERLCGLDKGCIRVILSPHIGEP